MLDADAEVAPERVASPTSIRSSARRSVETSRTCATSLRYLWINNPDKGNFEGIGVTTEVILQIPSKTPADR